MKKFDVWYSRHPLDLLATGDLGASEPSLRPVPLWAYGLPQLKSTLHPQGPQLDISLYPSGEAAEALRPLGEPLFSPEAKK